MNQQLKHIALGVLTRYLSQVGIMGNNLSPQIEGVKALDNKSVSGIKRSREDTEIERSRIEEENLSTPRKKKLKTTSNYIFETLFVNGENSDVTIIALGKEWHLHKVYLCQAGYFSCMFSGAWKESEQNIIDMDIPDDNIDVEALNLVFGSLYKEDITIKPSIVISVLAASTMLGLDGLIQQCTDVMKETTNSKSVCSYHQAACIYGQIEGQHFCKMWLEKNLMTAQTTQLLKEISAELMEEIIHSPVLFVMQVEMDVYSMLKKWLFTQIEPSWEGSIKELGVEADAFFKFQGSENPCEFLDSEKGTEFSCVFKGLRLQHIINDLPSTRILEEDRIIPKTWLLPMYRRQWIQMLRVEQGHDAGPKSNEMECFADTSLRCGRVLNTEGEYCWRWTGYNFGVDLLVSFIGRLLIFKRNTHSQHCHGGVSLQDNRNVVFQTTVASFDSLGHVQFTKSTGVRKLSLGRDEEAVVMAIDQSVPFPLHVSCNFLVYTPRHSSRRRDRMNFSTEEPVSVVIS